MNTHYPCVRFASEGKWYAFYQSPGSVIPTEPPMCRRERGSVFQSPFFPKCRHLLSTMVPCYICPYFLQDAWQLFSGSCRRLWQDEPENNQMWLDLGGALPPWFPCLSTKNTTYSLSTSEKTKDRIFGPFLDQFFKTNMAK